MTSLRSLFPLSQVCRGLTAVALAAMASGAGAAPVTVAISTFTFTVGGGYGTESTGNNKLDATFSNAAFAAQNFVLTNLNDSFTFNVGSVVFNEDNIGGQETDDLGLGANFTFTNPLGVGKTLSTTGEATTGTVNSDGDVDFSVSWAPLSFSFGNGGELTISMSPVSFTRTGTIGQTATVTLTRAEDLVAPAAVPEPASLALAGLALVLLGGARRMRRA